MSAKLPKFEVYDADNQRVDSWRWRLRAKNGEIIASGEGYTSQRDAIRASRAVARNAAIAVLVLK